MSAVAPAPTSKQPRKSPRKGSSFGASEQQHDTSSNSPDSPRAAGAPVAVTTDVSASSASTSLDDDLLTSIANKHSVLLQPAILTITLYIPTSSVGAIIGRRGQNISELQKLASQAAQTNAPVRVSVIGPDHRDRQHPQQHHPQEPSSSSVPYTPLDFSNPDWTPVLLRADPRAALTAAWKLQDMLTDAMTTSGGQQQQLENVILDIPVSRNKHAAIVGKRGVVLANISADTNVRIMVPNKDLRHDIIQLEGLLPQVTLCLDRILQVAVKAGIGSSPSTSGNNKPAAAAAAAVTGTAAPTSSSMEFSQTILCTTSLSQQKLRSVSRKHDVSVKKKRAPASASSNDGTDAGGQLVWQVTVSGGTQEAVQAACTSLLLSVDSNSNHNPHDRTMSPLSPSRGRGGGGGASSLSTNKRGRNRGRGGGGGGRGSGGPKSGGGTGGSAGDSPAGAAVDS